MFYGFLQFILKLSDPLLLLIFIKAKIARIRHLNFFDRLSSLMHLKKFPGEVEPLPIHHFSVQYKA